MTGGPGRLCRGPPDPEGRGREAEPGGRGRARFSSRSSGRTLDNPTLPGYTVNTARDKPEANAPRWSSGLGRRPLTAETRGSNPLRGTNQEESSPGRGALFASVARPDGLAVIARSPARLGACGGSRENECAGAMSNQPLRRLCVLSEEPKESAWSRWKRFATRAASFQARVLLTLMYWIILTPFALATKACGDPLHLASRRGGRWSALADQEPGRQF